jgi:hypothetical protein
VHHEDNKVNKIFLVLFLKQIFETSITEKYISRSEEKDPRDEQQVNVPVEHHLFKCKFYSFLKERW